MCPASTPDLQRSEKKAKIPKMVKESLIGTEQLSEILETVIFTAYLKNAIPISVILVGPSGAGKSKLVLQYQNSIGCHITTDVTSMGLQEIMARDKEGKINFIIIPDFNIVLSHRQSTLQLTIGNLLSMTSEGSIRIDDGRLDKETKHGPIGVISAMTSEMYAGIGRKWVSLGFSRRFLPINYDYSLHTREAIQNHISLGLVSMLQLVEKKIHAPSKDSEVAISTEHSERIKYFSSELAGNLGWIPVRPRFPPAGSDGKFTPRPKAVFSGRQMEFSPHLVLRTLARAHALRQGRKEVSEDDIIFCMKVIAFTRYDQPVML